MKKLLVLIDLHIEIVSTVFVFLLCVFSYTEIMVEWINAALLGVYIMNFMGVILLNNYKAIDKIYVNQVDKERAKCSLPITITYTILLFVGFAIMVAIFEINGIENNTTQAMKLCGIFLLGILTATIGYLIECNKINKWNSDKAQYKIINKTSVGSMLICLILFGLMCIV